MDKAATKVAPPPSPAAGRRAPPPKPPPPGQDVWLSYTDDATRHVYYVNERTGETTWDKPARGAVRQGDLI